MNTKKKISLVLALVMSASLLATGCKKTDEETVGLTDTTSEVSELTQMTESETTTTTKKETETTTETETESETESESETETETETETDTETETSTATSASSVTTSGTTVTTTTAAKTTTTAATTASKSWKETEISETMYTTQACYSRKKPIVGAETVSQYKKGTKVEVVAATDTGYYKLADGSFIHSDYLTDEKPAATTKATTTAKKTESETTTTTEKASSTTSVASTTYNKDYTTRYGYKTLTADQKTLYANIVEAAYKLETKVTVPSSLLSDDITKVYTMVFCEEPQLFWISRSVPSGYGSITIKYEIDDAAKIASIQKNIDSNVKTILASANQYSSTYGKLKVFYDWIVKNNEFSLSEDSYNCSIMNGLTVGGNLQCNGYAKSMQYLCDLAGIESMVIIGKNPAGSTHAWNVVYCDNGYYNLDATWGDPVNDHDSNYVRYNFFLVPDSWIVNDHLSRNLYFKSNGSTIKLFDPPSCTKTTYNYFKVNNKEFSTLSEAEQGLYDELDAAIKAGKNVAEIRVTSSDIWSTLLNDKYAAAFQKYAKSKGASKLSRQKTYADGVLVVQYDIFY
jgi:transglutaminase/protease-like cytokinesis protein 3